MVRALSCLASLVVFLPTAAVAHSQVVDADPADGSRVSMLPRHMRVTFDEAPTAVDVALQVPGGRSHPVASSIDGLTVVVDLPTTGPRGTYRVALRVVSDDGHPVVRVLRFTVTTGQQPDVPDPSPQPAGASTHHRLDWSLLGLCGIAGAAILAAVVLVSRKCFR